MAIVGKWYLKGYLAMLKNDVDIETADLYVSFHSSSYTPNLDTHDFADDLTNEITNGSGYTTGGLQVGTQTLSTDAASDQVRFDHDDLVVPFSAVKTFRYAVYRNKRGGASSADELLILLDWGADQSVGVSWTLAPPAAGLMYTDLS